MKQMKDLAVQTETPFAATSSGERMRTALNKVLGGQPVRTGEVKPEDIEGSTAKFVPLEQGGFGIQPPPPPPAPVQGLLHGDISVQDGQTRFGVNLLQKLVSDGNLSVPEAVQRFHQVVGESGTKILAGLKRGQVLIDNRGRQWRFDGESLSRVPGNQMPGANRAMADWAAGVETAKPEKYRVIDQNGALKPDQKAIDIAARSRVNARPVSPAEARPEMGKVSEKITEATKTPPRPAPIYSPVEREPVRDKQDLAEAQRTVEEYQRTAEQPSFLKGLNAYWNWRDRGREEVGVMSLRPPEEEGAQLISELNEIAERNNYAGYEDLITSLQRQREYGRSMSTCISCKLASTRRPRKRRCHHRCQRQDRVSACCRHQK
jgi:hypothetical protein